MHYNFSLSYVTAFFACTFPQTRDILSCNIQDKENLVLKSPMRHSGQNYGSNAQNHWSAGTVPTWTLAEKSIAWSIISCVSTTQRVNLKWIPWQSIHKWVIHNFKSTSNFAYIWRQILTVVLDPSAFCRDWSAVVALAVSQPHLARQEYMTFQTKVTYSCMSGSTLQPIACVTLDRSVQPWHTTTEGHCHPITSVSDTWGTHRCAISGLKELWTTSSHTTLHRPNVPRRRRLPWARAVLASPSVDVNILLDARENTQYIDWVDAYEQAIWGGPYSTVARIDMGTL